MSSAYLDLDPYSGFAVDARRSSRALAGRNALLEAQCKELHERDKSSTWMKVLFFILIVLLLWWLISALSSKKSGRGGSYGSYGQPSMDAGAYYGPSNVVSRLPASGGYGNYGRGGGAALPFAAGALTGAAAARAAGGASNTWPADMGGRQGVINSRTAAIGNGNGEASFSQLSYDRY